MDKIDFTKYKQNIIDYLKLNGAEIKDPGTNFKCILHDDGNDPAHYSMHVYGDRVKCFGCGFTGDIYDLAGAIHGETNRSSQYELVSEAFGASFIPPRISPPCIAKDDFIIDQIAVSRIRDYLKTIRHRYDKEVSDFCRARGFGDDYGAMLAWWPGISRALEDGVSKDTLVASGIIDPRKDQNRLAYNASGIILSIASGFKLHYIKTREDGTKETIKRDSRGAHTFPFPPMPSDGVAVLVEGELDAISCRYAGIAAVSTGGTNGLSNSDYDSLNMGSVILAFDNDSSGKKATQAIANRFGSVRSIDWSMFDCTEEKDVDDMIKHGKLNELKAMLANPKEVKPNETNTNRDKDLDGSTRGDDTRGEGKGDDGKSSWVDTYSEIVPREKIPFQFLGFDYGSKYYYALPASKSTPVAIPSGDKGIANQLKEIAPASWWMAYFSKTTEDGKEYFDKEGATEWFRREQERKGMYNDEDVRGIGAYCEKDGSVVVNTGSSVVHPNGSVASFNEYLGSGCYVKSPLELEITATPWTKADSRFFWDQLKTFSFENPASYLVMTGFCAIAPFASIIETRPHVWLTAQKGTGKTFLCKKIVMPILGNTTLYKEGGTTEAGIRQNLKSDCRPVFVDEFEANQKADLPRMNSILALVRSAYMEGASISKGTSGGTAMNFKTRSMFMFASVNVNIQDEATRSRIVVCRMKKSNGVMKAIKNPDGLRSRVFLRLGEVRKNTEIMRDQMIEAGCEYRDADTYSPLYSAAWMVLSDNPYPASKKDVREEDTKLYEHILSQFPLPETKRNEVISDEDMILERIFQQRIRIDSSTEKTIAEMLTTVDQTGIIVYGDALQKYGIRRIIHNQMPSVNQGKPSLAIALSHAEIQSMLSETAFTNYKEVVKRHHAVVKTTAMVNIARQNQSSVVLDWAMIEGKYFSENSIEEYDDDIPF